MEEKSPTQGEVLAAVFEKVYGIKFDAKNPNHRDMLQSAVYLLECMGLNVGDYGFSWK